MGHSFRSRSAISFSSSDNSGNKRLQYSRIWHKCCSNQCSINFDFIHSKKTPTRKNVRIGVIKMRILASLHDPKKERYAIYYSVILLVVIIATTLLVTGIFEISPIEGSLMFFEGFVALFMLTRHEKVSLSFSNHLSNFNANLKSCYNSMSKINFKIKP